MYKQDITQYGDKELNLMVFNDEVLYRERFKSGFIDLLRECFTFSEEQLDTLKHDLASEVE